MNHYISGTMILIDLTIPRAVKTNGTDGDMYKKVYTI